MKYILAKLFPPEFRHLYQQLHDFLLSEEYNPDIQSQRTYLGICRER